MMRLAICSFSAARDGEVDVGAPFLFVADVSLLLEDAKEGADGGVARRVGEPFHHLGCGRAADAEEEVHDLSLAAAEVAAVVARMADFEGARHDIGLGTKMRQRLN